MCPKGADGMIISVGLGLLYPSLPTLNYYPKPGIKLELENKSFELPIFFQRKSWFAYYSVVKGEKWFFFICQLKIYRVRVQQTILMASSGSAMIVQICLFKYLKRIQPLLKQRIKLLSLNKFYAKTIKLWAKIKILVFTLTLI